MNKFKNWTEKNLVKIQIFIVIFFLLLSLIAEFSKNTLSIIVVMLTLLGVDVFILAVGYFDKIIQYITNDIKVVPIDKSKINISELIRSANYNVFICGTSLASVASYSRDLRDLPDNVKIELYNINPQYYKKNKDIFTHTEICLEDFETSYKFFLNQVLGRLKDRMEVYAYSVDCLFPITYIAIDTDVVNAKSIILGEHYMLGKKYDLLFQVKPGSELYDKYKQQIELIRNKPRKAIEYGGRNYGM